MTTAEMKPWQKGQSLEDLQKLTEPFKRAISRIVTVPLSSRKSETLRLLLRLAASFGSTGQRITRLEN